jgi:hypothetical protein
MLEETGFLAREELDDFLILTCPRCGEDIVFTQRADPAAIRETAQRHTGRCSARRAELPRGSGVEVPRSAWTVRGGKGGILDRAVQNGRMRMRFALVLLTVAGVLAGLAADAGERPRARRATSRDRETRPRFSPSGQGPLPDDHDRARGPPARRRGDGGGEDDIQLVADLVARF